MPETRILRLERAVEAFDSGDDSEHLYHEFEALADKGVTSLLGTNKSDIATDTLIKLLSLRLDANNYERFRGFIILRGDSLVDRLEQLNPWQMARYCRARVQELRDKGYWKDINDVTMEQVCRSETEITQKTEALLKAIKSGVACKPAGCGEPSESQQN